jgi:predicted nucleic acid-binding protein
MTLVVDASVAIKWYLDEPHADAALELVAREPDLIAPDLVVAEVGNALWKRQRQGEITAEHVNAIAIALPKAFAALSPAADLIADALTLADHLDHPVYDCLYLALAARRQVELVTADRRLVRRVQADPVSVRIRLLMPGADLA